MKFIVVLFLFLGCAFGGHIIKRDTGDSAWDELIDQGIDAAREDIINKHLDLIKIPAIDQEIHETVLGIPFSVIVKVKGAEFWNVSTVQRRGPVTVLQDEKTGNITISTALGLDDFYLSVKNLYLKAFGFSISGALSTHCASNALEFSISLITDEEDNCKAYINWARLTSFQSFTIQITPSGLLNWLVQHIVTIVLNDFSSHVIKLINADLTNELNAVIGNVDICGYLPM